MEYDANGVDTSSEKHNLGLVILGSPDKSRCSGKDNKFRLRKQTNHRAKWSLHSFNFLAKFWSRKRIEFENPFVTLSHILYDFCLDGAFYYSPNRDLLPLFSTVLGKFQFFGIWKRKRVLAVALNQFILTFSCLDWICAVFVLARRFSHNR